MSIAKIPSTSDSVTNIREFLQRMGSLPQPRFLPAWETIITYQTDNSSGYLHMFEPTDIIDATIFQAYFRLSKAPGTFTMLHSFMLFSTYAIMYPSIFVVVRCAFWESRPHFPFLDVRFFSRARQGPPPSRVFHPCIPI